MVVELVLLIVVWVLAEIFGVLVTAEPRAYIKSAAICSTVVASLIDLGQVNHQGSLLWLIIIFAVHGAIALPVYYLRLKLLSVWCKWRSV
jgi:hypothetical protein